MQVITQKMIRTVAKEVTGSAVVEYQGKTIDFKSPFRWISMNDLIKEKVGIDFSKINSFEEANHLGSIPSGYIHWFFFIAVLVKESFV